MSTTLEQAQYGFDRNSRRTWQTRPLTDTQDLHHDYDVLSQVTSSARGNLNLNTTAISAIPAVAENWDYDPTGNWRGYQTSGATGAVTLDQHRVHDRGNRMTQIEGSSSPVTLDRVGRMRQTAPNAAGDWSGKLELEWDAWSRITLVKSNGSEVGTYSYDGLHRRTTRLVSGVTWHTYYSDVWRPLEERKNNEITAAISHLWGTRHRDDLVRRDRAVGGTILDETRYVLMDYFNPAAITDENGVVKERYSLSAFGVRRILNPDFTPRTTSESAFEFAFQGQFRDTESGLMNYGYRYYSPYLGRWTCKDPIGYRGGTNLYRMVRNRAVNQVDKFGLQGLGDDVNFMPAYPDGPPSVWDGPIMSPTIPPPDDVPDGPAPPWPPSNQPPQSEPDSDQSEWEGDYKCKLAGFGRRGAQYDCRYNCDERISVISGSPPNPGNFEGMFSEECGHGSDCCKCKDDVEINVKNDYLDHNMGGGNTMKSTNRYPIATPKGSILEQKTK